MALFYSTGEDLNEGSVSTEEICPASGNAELMAASLVDLPGGTEIGSEESSISTPGESLGSENAELPPAKTGIEACQERSRDQTNKQSKDEITSQQEPPSPDMEAARLNQDSLTTAGIETAINPTPAHDRQIVGGLIKSGRQTPRTAGASCRLPPHLPKPRHWLCGHCLDGRQMSIRLDLFCASCGRRKDYYATEYWKTCTRTIYPRNIRMLNLGLLSHRNPEVRLQGVLSLRTSWMTGTRVQAYCNVSPHPSLIRKRPPLYRYSVFSRYQSIYRNGDANDHFTFLLFMPHTLNHTTTPRIPCCTPLADRASEEVCRRYRIGQVAVR